MGDMGKKGSKGPDRVVAPEYGNDNQGQSESPSGGVATPAKPSGTRGSKGGAR